VKDLYNEHYKPLKKSKTSEDGKLSLWSWIGRLYIVKMAILLKVIYRSNAILIKIPVTFVTEIEKSLKIMYSQGNSEQKRTMLEIPNFNYITEP
jgi:hypothetical protein